MTSADQHTGLSVPEGAGSARLSANGDEQSLPRQWFEADPLWFKHAVFYEIHIRGFYDANGDGSGDFRGLIEKLDYLSWLGIDCIWLLPMYPSPLRDGGYDIAGFETIHPDYGTLEDFRRFVELAHQRGMRVIADLVLSGCSSRLSPPCPERSSAPIVVRAC